MRVLIVGGDGMLGHRLLLALSARHTVRVTLRRAIDEYAACGLFSDTNAYEHIDVRDEPALRAALNAFRPEVVLNAAGIVKQRDESSDAIASIEVNALFPHRLARLCAAHDAYLVHYSTDCVFSGRSSPYFEDDVPDPVDLYGRSKVLGEPTGRHCITLRTSMIGFELSRRTGLLEWFLSQRGTVHGYRTMIFSGLTTVEQARIAEVIVAREPRLSGLYHVSADPISKLELLATVKRHFGLDIDIVPDDTVTIDRTLESSRFRRDFGYVPPSWDDMVAELATLWPRGRR